MLNGTTNRQRIAARASKTGKRAIVSATEENRTGHNGESFRRSFRDFPAGEGMMLPSALS